MNTLQLEAWERQAARMAVEREAAQEVLRQDRVAVIAGEEALDNADEAQRITQAIAEAVQREAHDRIAGIVSHCLAAVFDDPYEFRILFEQARGRTEARLVFVREGMEINPIDSSGGGVVDVAAFALRLSCLLLSRPAVRRLVVMDEPMKFVSEDKRPRVRAMLTSLATEFGVQFPIVTHINELRCGHVVEIDPE